MGISKEDYLVFLHEIYALSKQEAYFESTDLFKRYKFAEFESQNFPENLDQICEEIYDLIFSGRDDYLDYWLEDIDTFLLPKSIQDPTEKSDKDRKNCEGVFISNYKAFPKYTLEKVNYFIDASIPIHILSMLWSIKVGGILDKKVDEDCLGNRLESINPEKYEIPSRAFKLYFNQYEKWRDNAIEVGLANLNQKKNIFLIALDIKDCYYNLKINYQEIESFLADSINEKSEMGEFNVLNLIIEKINVKYLTFLKTKKFLEITHEIDPFSANEIRGLPIGLPSSNILCNWELSKLDADIKTKLNPLYYGRYVDDILIVINIPDSPSGDEYLLNNKKIINELFIQNKIFSDNVDIENVKIANKENRCEEKDYFFEYDKHLIIQKSKIIIHYYNSNFSYAGLKEFKKELAQKSSEFRFLPTEEINKELSECAYDLTFNGSTNKLRSLIGISENDNNLIIFLVNKIIEYRLCEKINKDKNEISNEIFKFFRGRNMFDFCRTWEKVFSFLILDENDNRARNISSFYNEARNTIENLAPMSRDRQRIIYRKVIEDTKNYLLYSICTPLGLLSEDFQLERNILLFTEKTCLEEKQEVIKKNQNKVVNFEEPIRIDSNKFIRIAWEFRNSNLIRHHYVSWPLLNYTNFKGNLLDFNFNNINIDDLQSEDIANESDQVLIGDEIKFKYSPKFIHFDEFQLYLYLISLLNLKRDNFKDFNKIIKTKNYLFNSEEGNPCNYPKDLNSILTKTEIENLNTKNSDDKGEDLEDAKLRLTYKIDDLYKKPDELVSSSNFVIGLANMKVLESNINKSYNPTKQPTLTHERQAIIFNLLNEANKNPKCDLVVLPEVSIPFSWLPFMVNHARRNDVGLIFGLEHWVIGNYALNFVVTILPFRNENNYQNCFVSMRIKNHYSPREAYDLETYRLSPPKIKPTYERFIWRGVSFTVYNCYELSDIIHRGLFRSDIDLLVAVEWNRDTNYYSNILESCIRDLHCYMVQVNTSQYGDSRISTPKKTEEMNILRVTGGDNEILIKGSIDIETLRQFQIKDYDPTDKRYKPTPAGYKHQNVLRRTKL